MPVKPLPVKAVCPSIPNDIGKISKRKPRITGDSGFSVALNSLEWGGEQNKALKRMMRLYRDCVKV